ncbi:MAG: CapA family protein [Ruminococcaceae bacterium]|nr:CapA family protein [Oscillospiraceae bacterium]
MKQFLQIFFLLLKNLTARITDKPMRLHLPVKTHKTVNSPSVESRFKQTEAGVFSNGRISKKATVLLAGDLLCQRKQQNAYRKEDGSFDFSEMFEPVEKRFKEADLVVGNLETICNTGLAYMHESITADGLPFLNAPPQFLTALKQAGFDAVCSANNHNCDGGTQGLKATLQELKKADLPVTGIFENENTKRYLLFDVNGIRVALLAYATFYNFKSAAIANKEMLNLYSEAKAKKDIADAKKDEAQFVISYIHWGTEYTHKVSRKQKQIAKELANAGCDFIAGSHSHVLQPFDVVNGVPCLYSFGNFISSQSKEGTRETVIVQLQLKEENGKVHLADLSAVPCKTSVAQDESEFSAEALDRKNDTDIFEQIKKVLGNKIKL